jgi:hypothetical protein
VDAVREEGKKTRDEDEDERWTIDGRRKKLTA